MDNINLLNRQKGSSMWGLLFGASLFVLFALITMKLVPVYLDNNKIISALESLAEMPGAATMTRRQVLGKINNTLNIDMADDLLDLNNTLVIKKVRGIRIFSLDYERVVPMAYNISALLDFENSVEVSLK